MGAAITFLYIGNYKLKYNFESNSQLGSAITIVEVDWEL